MNIYIRALFFTLFFCSSLLAMKRARNYEENTPDNEKSVLSTTDDVWFVIFAYLEPSEKAKVPLVCKHWLKLSKELHFAKNYFLKVKSIIPERKQKNYGYFAKESIRLEDVLKKLFIELKASPHFFIFQNNPRKEAEALLEDRYQKSPKQAFCLIRNSSHDHMIALSSIDGIERRGPGVDISASCNALHFSLVPAKSESSPPDAMPSTDKKKSSLVFHQAIEIGEDQVKNLQYKHYGSSNKSFDSLALLIADIPKHFVILTTLDQFNTHR